MSTADNPYITLNVGGTHFTTCLDTLAQSPAATLLGTMFAERNRHLLHTPLDKVYYFDRSPALFPYVLEYHRNHRVQFPLHIERNVMLDEYKFWGIPLPQVNPFLVDTFNVLQTAETDTCDRLVNVILECLTFHAGIDYYELNGTVIEMLPKPWRDVSRGQGYSSGKLDMLKKLFKKYPLFSQAYVKSRALGPTHRYTDSAILADIRSFHADSAQFPDPAVVCRQRANREYISDTLQSRGFRACWQYYRYKNWSKEMGMFYNPPYHTKWGKSYLDREGHWTLGCWVLLLSWDVTIKPEALIQLVTSNSNAEMIQII